MPPKTREWIYLPRTADLATLFSAVRDMDCLSVVGVSNLGKSATLRSLTNPKVQAEYLGDAAKDYLFIYIDFNQMLEMSDQAFYELLLRCSLDAMREAPVEVEVMRRVETAYTGLVAAINPAHAHDDHEQKTDAHRREGEAAQRRDGRLERRGSWHADSLALGQRLLLALPRLHNLFTGSKALCDFEVLQSTEAGSDFTPARFAVVVDEGPRLSVAPKHIRLRHQHDAGFAPSR